MIIKLGDITKCEERILIHQTNCVNKMASGVAKAIFTKWPNVKSEYHGFCEGTSPNDLIGNVQHVVTSGPVVFNVFSQYNRGRDGKLYTNYTAVKAGFYNVLAKLDYIFWNEDDNGGNIALPYLYGCGLGGGEWSVVSNIIDEVFGDRAVCYKFP